MKVGRFAREITMTAMAVLWCGAAVAALPERAAVVYSEWSGGSLANEYDGHLKKLGWAFDKYENVRLPELSAKLGNYRYVIATSVANYVKTVKMAPFAEAWRKWLADGGTLVVTDANYGSVLGDWVAAFGPGFESGCALCSAHTKPSDATRAVTVRPDPLLSCPKPLGYLFQKHYSQWTRACIEGRPESCTSRFAYSARLSQMCVLGNIAQILSGTALEFDPANRRFVDNDRANAMLAPPERKGFECVV